MIQSISTPEAPQAMGAYSQAIRAGGFLFISGQIPLDPATSQIVEGDIGVQTRRVLDSIRAILKADGLSIGAVVRTTVYLADMDDFAAMNHVYGAFFSAPYPARATVQVARLPRDVRIEIDVIAFRG